ncbi:MAG: hypothetical protein JNK29_15535, partial [Anaerolineales bacterium]|nr:hypothetical protein [Anaerolineales bacterium]
MAFRSELDEFFRRERRPRLGLVVGGSLSAGVDVKLDPGDVDRGVAPGTVIEELAVGKYVVIEGASGRRFFSLITDIALDHTNPDLLKSPPAGDDTFTQFVYGAELAFGRLNVAPMLVLEQDSETPKPVKTIPAHFTPVFEATPEDV